MTLRQAVQAYIVEQGKKTKNGLEAARSTRSRFNLLVVPYADENGRRWIDTPIARITTAEFAAWREWVVKLPVTRTGAIAGKPRKASTVNRDVASFRAALNLAAKVHRLHDHWSEVLKRDLVGDEGRGSEVYLKPGQRADLLASAAELAPHLRPLAKAMLIVPIRPGALAALTVADYDRRKHSLWIHTDKVNAGRWVTLPARNKDGTPHESVALLADLVHHKLPAAPLFANDGGGHWNAKTWNVAIKEVAAAAKLPKELTIYWLRHSRITDLITAGIAPMTIAKMAGSRQNSFHPTLLGGNRGV
ncbi:MAG: site-specific integrase [Variovorax sp.]|nr:site-specific integrase [Variovorax sp.]